MQCLSHCGEFRGATSPSTTSSAQGMNQVSIMWSTSQPRLRRSPAVVLLSRTAHCHERHAFGKATWSRRGLLHIGAATMNATSPSPQQRKFPAFIPREVEDIQEQVALDMAVRMERVPVNVPCMGRKVNTAFVGPATGPNPVSRGDPQLPPIVLVPSFDSSILEFRRLYPLLEARRESWAVDVAGWGFTDAGFALEKNTSLGPQEKREHLYSFWQQQVKVPMVLLGTSLGGTIALDFALAHPEAVAKLVLVDAQGFIDGIGPMSKAPRFVASLGVQLLKTNTLRQMANQMAYFDKSFATEDALRCGRLHTYLPGWLDANVAFIQSGGYSLSRRISELKPDVLILWGRHDQILSPSYAEQFAQALPNCSLRYMESSGHSAHLEEPKAMADVLFEFLGQ